MNKTLSIITIIACMISFGNIALAEETSKNLPKESNIKSINDKKSSKHAEKLPKQLRETFKFFKLADELNYTDDQLIKLRAYYKSYYSDDAVKKEESTKQDTPEVHDFYGMSEKELKKFAQDRAALKEKEIMSNLQKIIELNKILTTEQLESFKETKKDKEAKKEKENSKDNKKNESKSSDKKSEKK